MRLVWDVQIINFFISVKFDRNIHNCQMIYFEIVFLVNADLKGQAWVFVQMLTVGLDPH